MFLVPQLSYGDSWASATPIVAASPDGERLVRIIPGDSIGDTLGFEGVAKGAFARATFFHHDGARNAYIATHEADLLNPVSPVDAFVNNAGILVTLDNWHNMGYGAVVVIYRVDGKVLKQYSLEDLYTDERIREISLSVSSRWWRAQEIDPWINARELWLTDAFGGEFRFDLENGSYTYE